MSLSTEDNELLCRIEGQAPMGIALRENFWIPALLSDSLVAGGKPLPSRLFGENFVAFRATDGRVGFFDELCPHRGASLLLARNEDNALRCIYHGWKYDVSGKTVEVPTEPRNPEAFCRTVPLKHYPVHEAAGIVFVWLGRSAPQPFPDFEFTTLPPDHTYATKQLLRCNWLQNVEAGMDSAHVSVLHQAWAGGGPNLIPSFIGDDQAPIYEFENFPGGFRYAALRNVRAGGKYVRINNFVMPWFCLIAPSKFPDGDRLVLLTTPIDDYHTFYWNLKYNPFKPLSPSIHNPADDPDNFPPPTMGGRENAWGQDRAAMARGHFSGFGHLNTEDFAVCESQGKMADRSKEYLNSGDLAVVRVRQLLLDLVGRQRSGAVDSAHPHGEIRYNQIRALADILTDKNEWRSLVA